MRRKLGVDVGIGQARHPGSSFQIRNRLRERAQPRSRAQKTADEATDSLPIAGIRERRRLWLDRNDDVHRTRHGSLLASVSASGETNCHHGRTILDTVRPQL